MGWFRVFAGAVAFLVLCGGSAGLFAQGARQAFVRGDVNGDGSLDISDPLSTLGHLFLGTFRPECLDAADADDDGEVELTDAIRLLAFLFTGGRPPAEPFPACGADRTPGGPGCIAYAADRCPPAPVTSPILRLLEALHVTGTEPCCLPGLGTWPVRAGRCASLGGLPPGNAGCERPDAERPALLWSRRPSVHAVDAIIAALVMDTGALPLDLLTFDLYEIDAAGERVGPVRIASIPLGAPAAALLPGARELGAFLDVTRLEKGLYSLRATGWRLAVLHEEGVVQLDYGLESEVLPPILDEAVAVLDLESPFAVHASWAEVLSLGQVAALTAVDAPHDPLLEGMAMNVLASQDALRALEATISTPEMERLRRRMGEAEEEKAAAEAEEAEAGRRAADAEGRAAAVEDCLRALVLVNRFLDTWYGPEAIAALEELVRRREDILAGTAQEDRAALDEALSAKEARAAAIDAQVPAKEAELARMEKELADLTKAIEDQFRTMRHAAGNHTASIDFENGTVTYDVTAYHVTKNGVTEYAPAGKRYKAEEKKLKELIASYEDLHRRIEECREELEALRKERAALAENIELLGNAGSELDEIDKLLDIYFGHPRSSLIGPYLPELLDRLRACGEGWLADLLEGLFQPVPRTMEELQEFLRKLEALREAKHAREAEMAREIEEARAAAAAAEKEAEDAKARREAEEDEIRRLGDEHRRAAEEAEQEAREAEERAAAELKAEAERRRAEGAFRERLERLRKEAQDGSLDALAELAEMTGLNILDEAFPDLKLGSGIGKILSGAEFPECFCEFLEAFRALFSAQDSLLDIYAEAVAQKFLECTGLDQYFRIASVSGMAGPLADGVKAMPREQRRKAAAALNRVLELLDC